MAQDRRRLYHKIRATLIQSGGLKRGLGPFDDPLRRVGTLVHFEGNNFSSFLVIGKRHIAPGDTADLILLMADVTALHEGCEFELRDGNRIVGSGTVLAVIEGDWEATAGDI
jgi:hypothetical protein